MNRRKFLKAAAMTAAVGAVAPKVLAAEPVAAGIDTVAAANISKIAMSGKVYQVAMDISEWKWTAMPLAMRSVAVDALWEDLLVGGAYEPVTGNKYSWHPLHSEGSLDDELVVDNDASLAEDSNEMKQRANHATTFTPAANPQGHTPV